MKSIKQIKPIKLIKLTKLHKLIKQMKLIKLIRQIKLVIGLGNPGEKYKSNRHNVGHMFVNSVQSSKLKDQSLSTKFLKTDTFMNESGKSVKTNLTNLANLSNLYIVHDDLDISLGKFKIQFGVGPKVHNGVESVENELGTKEFWRIRIGVDNRTTDSGQTRMTGERYVLEDFTKEEREVLEKVFEEIIKQFKQIK